MLREGFGRRHGSIFSGIVAGSRAGISTALQAFGAAAAGIGALGVRGRGRAFGVAIARAPTRATNRSAPANSMTTRWSVKSVSPRPATWGLGAPWASTLLTRVSRN